MASRSSSLAPKHASITVTKCALDVTQFGGVFVKDRCVVDGNLVSCGTWHDYDTEFFKLFIAQLKKVPV